MQPSTQPSRNNQRARWLTVVGLFGVLLMSSGVGFYNLSVYINVFAEHLAVSTAEVSVLVTLFFLTGGIAGIWVADIIDRMPLRVLMLLGAALAGASLAASGLTDSLWVLYLLFVLFGIGNAGVSIVVSTTVITRWFPGPNRSVALSITSTGLSVGGVVITPISAYALESMGPTVVMPWIGLAFFIVVVPLVVLLIKPPPDAGVEGVEQPQFTEHRAVMRSRFYVLHTLAYVMLMAVQVGGISHLYSHAELLTNYEVAARCVQVLSVASIVSRFLGGWLLTKISAYRFTVANLVLQTIGVALLAAATDASSLILGAAVFGASVGNLLMLQPLQLAETYGQVVLARVFAMANAITLVGVAAGPLMLAVLRDVADYPTAFYTGVAVSGTAVLVLLAAQNPAKSLAR